MEQEAWGSVFRKLVIYFTKKRFIVTHSINSNRNNSQHLLSITRMPGTALVGRSRAPSHSCEGAHRDETLVDPFFLGYLSLSVSLIISFPDYSPPIAVP